MHLKLPTRWIAVLFFLSAILTFTACSKDHSFEKNNATVDEIPPHDDSTSNGDGDTTGNDDDDGDDSTSNGDDDDATTVADTEFMKQATYINRAQLTNGSLATERGTAQAVRDFGNALQLRFGAAQKDLDQKGVALNSDLPTQTDAAHQAVTNTLLDMEGRTFDISYIDYQLQELDKAVDLYVEQINNGKDPGLKAYAEKYLPYLREFLQTASNIRQTL